MELTLRRGHRAEIPAMLRIARGLPAWFTDRGVEHMAVDLRFQHRRVAVAGERIRGFLSYYVKEGDAYIGWLAVDPEMHRSGVGRALVAALEAELAGTGVARLLVETLGDGVDYEPYARTRAFYRSLGFVDWLRVERDDPECPELLTLAKALPAPAAGRPGKTPTPPRA
ncbi:MAG: GNAT family N-acetyltransferase [Candidatus Sericytochromatia bacterium]|nr:GNAT family N-acetyltransferase [Candidatus Tanganyikabacteria bacterium]